jgi:hypothetical protein
MSDPGGELLPSLEQTARLFGLARLDERTHPLRRRGLHDHVVVGALKARDLCSPSQLTQVPGRCSVRVSYWGSSMMTPRPVRLKSPAPATARTAARRRIRGDTAHHDSRTAPATAGTRPERARIAGERRTDRSRTSACSARRVGGPARLRHPMPVGTCVATWESSTSRHRVAGAPACRGREGTCTASIDRRDPRRIRAPRPVQPDPGMVSPHWERLGANPYMVDVTRNGSAQLILRARSTVSAHTFGGLGT